MKKPIVFSIWFDRHEDISRYKEYSKVWKVSAEKHLKDVEHHCMAVDPPNFDDPCPVFHRGDRKIGPSKTLSWLKKIDMWEKLIDKHPDRPILMCDTDIAFFGNPFDELLAGEFDFDVALCGNNTGAVYFSGSKKSREFMRQWWFTTHYLFDRPKLYQKLDKKYKGLDQSSMGYMLEQDSHNADVLQLPRRFHSIWNDYEHPCYLMHYHSALKSAVFNEKKTPLLGAVQYYKDAWLAYRSEVE